MGIIEQVCKRLLIQNVTLLIGNKGEKNSLAINPFLYNFLKFLSEFGTQNVSNSVKNAVEFRNFQQFNLSETTVHFIRILDSLFDKINSNSWTSSFKFPLRLKNEEI